MKQELFQELAKKWEQRGKPPDCQDGSPEAAEMNARESGYRAGLRQCAGDVTKLIALLGE